MLERGCEFVCCFSFLLLSLFLVFLSFTLFSSLSLHSHSLSLSLSLLLLLEELLVDELPQDGEHESLQAVGEDLGLQPSSEEGEDAVLLDDLLHGFGVRDDFCGRLSVDLNDSDGVGDRVGDDRGAEADEGVSHELELDLLVLGQYFLQGVVGEEPGIVSGEGSRESGHRSVVEHRRSAGPGLLEQVSEALAAVHLHGGLHGVDGHEEDSPESGCARGGAGLDAHGQVLGLLEVVEEVEHAGIGSGVSESRERALGQGRDQPSVESRNTSILPQGSVCLKQKQKKAKKNDEKREGAQILGLPEGFKRASSVPVLVVDGCSQPHESHDVQTHSNGSGRASAQSSLDSLV